MMTTITTEEGYLTQANLTDEHSRVFVKKISGINIIESEWKIVDQKTKDDWEAEYLNSNNNDML